VKIEVLTLFPEWVEQVGKFGMPRVAVETGALTLTTRNPRDSSGNKHRRVDDRSFGGGPGMVMQAEPLMAALEQARLEMGPAKVVGLSPQGERFDQAWAERLSGEAALILVCGRYEGLDERFVEGAVDVELSLGDFVMSGGELAAMAVIDAIARLLPGVLGHAQSAAQDSFSQGLLDHPHYSRPEIWRGQAVPDILMSGNHAQIAKWRLKQALGRTWLRRPDLIEKLVLDPECVRLLGEWIAEYSEAKKVEGGT
jgi:tRNA (guanine37-N1)-methyltransferase